jgi:hypothetical protein
VRYNFCLVRTKQCHVNVVYLYLHSTLRINYIIVINTHNIHEEIIKNIYIYIYIYIYFCHNSLHVYILILKNILFTWLSIPYSIKSHQNQITPFAGQHSICGKSTCFFFKGTFHLRQALHFICGKPYLSFAASLNFAYLC